jgi:urease accessory protein
MARVAQGRLSFERAGAGTVLRAAYAESPLRLLTPRNHGQAAWAFTSTLGGGFVDGDRVRLRISVGRGARAYVSTQGPTRVYRSPGGCESTVSAEVADGAALVLAPDPTACFKGARFRQRTDLDLAGGASVAVCDVLSAGRTGERWSFERCSLGLVVRRDGRTVLQDSWLLDAAHGSLGDRLGRFEALGTAFVAGPLFARDPLVVESQPVVPRSRLLLSSSPVGSDAVVLRLAAASVEELMRELRARLRMVPALLGDNPWAHRA